MTDEHKQEKRFPKLAGWQRTIGYLTIGAIAATAYALGRPSGPYTPQIEQPTIQREDSVTRMSFEICVGGDLEGIIEDLDVPEMQMQAYKAIIDHETGCDPSAVSRTGAAGLTQLTIPTASEHDVTLLHAPDQYFSTDDDSIPRFKEPTDSIARAYGEHLQQLVSGTERPDTIDGRFDPETAIHAFHEEFDENLSHIRGYVEDDAMSMRLALLAHNAGITRVLTYLEQGSRTPQDVLQRIQDEDIPELRKSEISRFYTSANAFFEAYGAPRVGGAAPEPAYLLLPEPNSQGKAVLRTRVVPMDSRWGIARNFNEWDARRGDQYEEVTYEDVVLANGTAPDTLHPGQILYVTAPPKVRDH